MASFTWRKVKIASSSLSDARQLTWFTNPLDFVARVARPSLLIGILSVLLYGLSVSHVISKFCTAEIRHGALVAQACQYVSVMLSGMLMGTATGPRIERTTCGIWRLLTGSADNQGFRHSQFRSAITVLLISSLANLLFLLQRLNQFVDVHAVLKSEVLVLVYVMGVLMGAAWFMLLHRQSIWGILASCAMSMMVVSSTLSIHSWS